MAFNIGSLSVRLLADARQFTATMNRAKSRAEGFAMALGRVARVGATATAVALGAVAHAAYRTNLQLSNLATQINEDVRELQALSFAASQSNVSMENFLITTRRIARRASDAAGGNKEMAKTFALLGIDADKFVKLGVTDKFRALGQAIRLSRNQAVAQSLAFKLLDTEGQAMLQMFMRSPEAFESYLQRAKDVGLVNAEAAAGTAILSDAMDALLGTLKGGANTALAGFKRGFEWLSNKIKSGKQAAAEVLPENVAAMLGLETAAQEALRREVEKTNAAKQAQAALNDVAISQEKKRKLLQSTAKNMGEQINLATTFVGRSGPAAKASKVEAPQLDTTNRILSEMVALIRNNRTGAVVTFSG